MNLPRIEIFAEDNIETFARKLSGTDAQANPSDSKQGVELTDPEQDIVAFGDSDKSSLSNDLIDDLSKLGIADNDRGEIFTRRWKPERIQDFDIERARPALGNDMMIHPDYAPALAARLDALIAEFVRLRNQLLNTFDSPVTLQKTLKMLFAQPVTGSSCPRCGPWRQD